MKNYEPSTLEKCFIAIPYLVLGFAFSIAVFYPLFMIVFDAAAYEKEVSSFVVMFGSKYFLIWSGLCAGVGVYSAFFGVSDKLIFIIKLLASIILCPLVIRYYLETGEWMFKKGFLQN